MVEGDQLAWNVRHFELIANAPCTPCTIICLTGDDVTIDNDLVVRKAVFGSQCAITIGDDFVAFDGDCVVRALQINGCVFNRRVCAVETIDSEAFACIADLNVVYAIANDDRSKCSRTRNTIDRGYRVWRHHYHQMCCHGF